MRMFSLSILTMGARLVCFNSGAQYITQFFTDGVMYSESLNHKNQLMEETDWRFCPKTSVSTDAFFAFYQKEKEFWNAHLYLPQTKVPILIIAASNDEHQPNIDEYVKPYMDGKPIFLTVIEGAGHFFRDLNIEDAVEKVVEFVDKLETTSS